MGRSDQQGQRAEARSRLKSMGHGVRERLIDDEQVATDQGGGEAPRKRADPGGLGIAASSRKVVTTWDVAAVPKNWQPPPGEAQAWQPSSAASSRVSSPWA